MNRSKAKGTRWESQVAEYLGVERLTLKGNKDEGDLNVPGWTIECKAEKQIDLAGYAKELEVEQKNRGTAFGAVIIKRPRQGTAAGYVVMNLEQFQRLLGWPRGSL